MDTREIKKMSRIERLQAMEALWDSLVDEESEVESPEWHRDILDERRRKIETGKAEFISIEELRAGKGSSLRLTLGGCCDGLHKHQRSNGDLTPCRSSPPFGETVGRFHPSWA